MHRNRPSIGQRLAAPRRTIVWMRRLRGLIPLALAAGVLMSCSTLSYYSQAVNGQYEILNKRRPIAQVIEDPTTPPELRTRLSALSEIREFASRHLALPDNRSYRSYADLKRSYVIWNVFATEEFSIEPVQWCFPFAGCVPYRGYFAKAAAQAFVADLPKDKRYDVYVGGVPAYSTLGWFDDPVLNTFVHYPEIELARLVFHELAHQVAYVKGDAMFNESFATAVEEAGVERWLAARGDARLRDQWQRAQRHRQGFHGLVLDFRKRLEELYASALDPMEKRAKKAQTFADLRAAYRTLKQGWNGYNGYDRWIEQDLNNAHLAAIAIYTEQVPAFHALLDDARGDFAAFYAAVKQLARQPKAERDAKLDALTARGAREAALARP